jgi:hypothetical protein
MTLQVFDTNLVTQELADEIITLPYTCTRTDTPPTENNPNVEYAGMYWTHQLHNFCPIEDPDYFQNAGLSASNNTLWQDILTYLEAVVPNMPNRDHCYSAYINVLRYGNSPGIHVDAPYDVPENKTVLVYMNPTWHPEWAGETVFFDEDLDAKYICQPRPGRVVMFDGRIPHTGRPPGPKFMFNRYILAFKYMDPDIRQSLFVDYEKNHNPPPVDHGIAGFDSLTVKEIWRNIALNNIHAKIK